MKTKLTQDYLKECLTYNPGTGIFVWNERPISHFNKNCYRDVWNKRFSQKEAGNLNHGYLVIRICGDGYRAHRLAFLYMEGYVPENDVDHINRIRDDNRWINLREISHRCNLQNCNLSKANRSGVCGVYWHKPSCKWQTLIKIYSKIIYLGHFKNFEDAVMARYKEELNNPLWTCSVESTAYKYLKDNNLF